MDSIHLNGIFIHIFFHQEHFIKLFEPCELQENVEDLFRN